MKNTKKRNKNNWLKLSLNRKIFFVAVLCLFASGVVAILIPSQPNNYIVNESQAAGTQNPDINNSGQVDVFDLSMLLASWGTAGVGSGDLNGDGTVDVFDLSMLLSNWGPYTPTVVRPNETNTGYPDSQILKTIDNYPTFQKGKDYTIDEVGRVTILIGYGSTKPYNGIYFPNGVVIKGDNITITSSKIEGGRTSFVDMPAEPTASTCSKSPKITRFLVDAFSYNHTNFVIKSTRIKITSHSVYINAVMGFNISLEKVNISGGVDNIGFYNNPNLSLNEDNTTFSVRDSYLHHVYSYNYDPMHDCGPTHSDAIQTKQATNLTIENNTIYANSNINSYTQEATNNSAIMITKPLGSSSKLKINNNYIDYGLCSVHVDDKNTGQYFKNLTLTNNIFGNDGSKTTCAMKIDSKVFSYSTNNISGNKANDGTILKYKALDGFRYYNY